MSLDDLDALKNASAIIERFGGIRPMAAKVGAPVTTVQGWKKRDVIPGARRDDILRAANENSIDLSDILSGADVIPLGSPFLQIQPTNENDNAKISVEAIAKPQSKPFPSALSPRIDTTHEELMEAIEKGQKKAVRASLWGALALLVVGASAATLALLPEAKKIERHEDQIAALSGKVTVMDEDLQKMGSLEDYIPEDMQAKFASLKTEAEGISKTVAGLSTGSLSDRIAVIEAKIAEGTGGQAISDLTARIRNLEVTILGQEQLNASVGELSKIVDSLDGQMGDLNKKLAEVQNAPQKTALGETIEGVSPNEMKAAAMLVAFSQLRESLNRNVSFKDDVVLLQKLVGNDDPALTAALEKLAPQAEKGGVLTAEGLSKEFKGVAGDIVFSSLKGEDVSITDKAKVRLTQILNVKKDGEIVGGTQAQKTVSKAQAQLDAGDVKGAVATLKTLEGVEADQAAPFIEQAQATLLADDIQVRIRALIAGNAGIGVPMNAATGAAMANDVIQTVKDIASPDVVTDEASGVTILPTPKGFKGFSAGQ